MNKLFHVKPYFFCFVVSVFLTYPVSAQSDNEGDWFSANTLAAVVKLSSVLEVYEVEGLPDNYTYRTKGGEPDFCGATVISERMRLVSVGTGVVISESGLIISNAHVTRAYCTPEIHTLSGSKGIKQVIVNPFPNAMFVGVTDSVRLAKGDDSQQLQYIAFVVSDEMPSLSRDRAVLQVLYRAHMGSDGIPAIDEKLNAADIHMACVNFGNPFTTSFVDRKVRTIGFPGTGDPNRSARTSGELLGYEDQKSSRILHTSYISGGNSGGGLFYKDSLIGINTWDKVKNVSRPVAVAQPITYWFDMLIKAQWLYPGLTIPDGMFLNWLSDDPGKEPYKDEVQVLFSLVAESNKNVPVTNGTLYVHRTDTTIEDVLSYIDIAERLDKSAAIVYYLQYYTLDEVAKEFGCSRSYVEQFQSVTEKKQLRDMLKPHLRSYFDEWDKGSFYCKVIRLDDRDGKAMVSVPKNSRLHITYLADNTGSYTTLTLTCNDEYVQGPYTVAVRQ